MWLNCPPGISGTIPRISGTIPGISGTKKSLSRKRLYRRMMTCWTTPQISEFEKKDYIPGKNCSIWQNLFFPFVPFFLHTLELLGGDWKWPNFISDHWRSPTTFERSLNHPTKVTKNYDIDLFIFKYMLLTTPIPSASPHLIFPIFAIALRQRTAKLSLVDLAGSERVSLVGSARWEWRVDDQCWWGQLFGPPCDFIATMGTHNPHF